jgi:glycolate oxidase FAD binding subunit
MPLSRYDVAIDLTALGSVTEYEPADLTVSVQAGMRLSDLQATLREDGQWLPLDPPASERMTVGGLLATNASGPGRAVYGTPRDFLIGIAVATPAGELVRAGGRVVKNVAGYDLGKLYIGALGTLGVITRASFKVAPLPEVSRTLTVSAEEPGALLALATQARRRGLSLNRLCLLGPRGEDGWRLLVRMAGGEEAMGASIRQIDALAGAGGMALQDADESDWGQLDALVREADVVAKAAAPPSSVAGVLDALRGARAAIASYPTAGIAYGCWPAGQADAAALVALRQICVQERGALVIERAPVELRLTANVWGDPRADLAIMQRLKEQFDPRHTLNPGRFIAGI